MFTRNRLFREIRHWRMDTPHTAMRTTRRRSHALRIARERLNGKYRFKIAGYYVEGNPVRKYFDTRKNGGDVYRS